jgi:cell division protein YceG involved in septum cleavage
VGEKLVYAGLIKDKRLFTDEIGKRGLSGSIEVGEYKISNGADIDTIIKALTR